MSESMVPPASLGQRLARSVDWVIVTLLGAVAVMALVNLDSAESGDWAGRFFTTQLRFVVLGAVVMAGARLDDRRIVRRDYGRRRS